MEFLTLAAFCCLLLVCLLFDLPILLALSGGLLLFVWAARHKGFGAGAIWNMCLSGIMTARNVLIMFALIGVLTALWRAAGTIPAIICYASWLFVPSCFLTVVFLLNCLVSVLTGTAFGTGATMGVVCAAVATSLGVDPALLGGAVLAGVFFGDRWSPVSTSALLVSELTMTDLFTLLRLALRTTLVPFLLSCGIYTAISFTLPGGGDIPDLPGLFSKAFVIEPLCLLPAIAILVLALRRVRVLYTLLISILLALPVALLIQGHSPAQLLEWCITGYTPQEPELQPLLSGGGLLSMARVAAIITISSAYAGLFQQTCLLIPVQQRLEQLAVRYSYFSVVLLASTAVNMIACNQTLGIILTKQLRANMDKDNTKLDASLSDSAVIVAPLVPWSIAAGVPLASVGAPSESILWACFLYLLPLWHLVKEHRENA